MDELLRLVDDVLEASLASYGWRLPEPVRRRAALAIADRVRPLTRRPNGPFEKGALRPPIRKVHR